MKPEAKEEKKVKPKKETKPKKDSKPIKTITKRTQEGIPEETHPKKSGRPKKNEGDEVEITNTSLSTEKTQSYWKKQSPNEIRAQLVLRGVPRSKTGFMKKTELLATIKEMVKNNNW